MSFWEFDACLVGYANANAPDDAETDMLGLLRDYPDLAEMIPVGGMN